MENITSDALIRQLIAQQQQKGQGIQDRFDKIDQFGKEVYPLADQNMEQLAGQRPAGYNPLQTVLSSFNQAETRNRAYDQANAMDESNTSALSTLVQLLQNNEQFNKEYNLSVAESGGSLDESGNVMLDTLGQDLTVQGYVEQIKNGSLKVNGVPADSRDAVVRALAKQGVTPGEAEKAGEQSRVMNIINSLKGIYGKGTPETSDDLSKGSWLQGLLTGGKAKLNIDKDAKLYSDTKSGIIAQIRELVGEKGIMTDTDAKRLERLLPDFADDPTQAQKKWAFLEQAIQFKYANPNKPLPINQKEIGEASSSQQSTNNDPLGVR